MLDGSSLIFELCPCQLCLGAQKQTLLHKPKHRCVNPNFFA